MKKAIVGLAALGVIVGIRRVSRIGHNMREHFQQMAAQCKQIATQLGGDGKAAARICGPP
jgi:hypothetical protein